MESLETVSSTVDEKTPVTRILLVDDDRDVLDALYRYLTDAGMAVIPRGRPDEALHDLANEQIDLVLSDFEMGPYMNGVEFGLEAAKMKPAVPFVIITGSNITSVELFALEAGLYCTVLGKGVITQKEIVAHLRQRMSESSP